jgi:hypothetical protein
MNTELLSRRVGRRRAKQVRIRVWWIPLRIVYLNCLTSWRICSMVDVLNFLSVCSFRNQGSMLWSKFPRFSPMFLKPMPWTKFCKKWQYFEQKEPVSWQKYPSCNFFLNDAYSEFADFLILFYYSIRVFLGTTY